MKKKHPNISVTGLGAITPLGNSVNTFWNNLINGKSGVTPITRFDTSQLKCGFAAQIKDFDPLAYMDRKTVRDFDEFVKFAVAAAGQALEESKILEHVAAERIGICFGNCVGGMEALIEAQTELSLNGAARVSPKFIFRWIPNIAANQIATQYKLRGPSLTVSTACASSNDAIGRAVKMLRDGEVDAVLAGGSEHLTLPITMAGLGNAHAISTHNEDPAKASRPFDKNRDGFVIGEGSAFAVLERREQAEKRGAKIYCNIVGYANNAEGYSPTSPAPDGRGEILAMKRALEDAGLQPEEIDYVNAHATSTIVGDVVETLAIHKVFGDHADRLAVSSIKGAVGHMIGASGAIEFVAIAKAFEENILPPTINYDTPDPECDLDYIPNKARKQTLNAALSNAFGFGGQNACLVFKRNPS